MAYGITKHASVFILQMLMHVLQPLFASRSRGGLDAERAERIKCKQEDMDRDRRNFEAMQVRLHSQHSPTLIVTSLEFLPLPSFSLSHSLPLTTLLQRNNVAQYCAFLSLSMIRVQPNDLLYALQPAEEELLSTCKVCTCAEQAQCVCQA